MFIDFREYNQSGIIDCDLCIIGAGAAGITLAQSFAGSDVQVCLLESGGFEFDQDTQNLNQGKVLGLQNSDPMACRVRGLGGTTQHWAGHCRPLSPWDFEPRSWIPGSGWPIRIDDLLEYYRQAQEVCDLGAFEYDNNRFLSDRYDYPAFLPDKILLRFWQFGPPTRFGRKYRQLLADARNINVFLFANVIGLRANAHASALREVEIRSLNGKSARVRARFFALCGGGMETTRLLLVSNDVERKGLGNGSGLVGSYFMQHPEKYAIAQVSTDRPEELAYMFTRQENTVGVKVAAELAISPQVQQRLQILNCAFTLDESEWRYMGMSRLREDWEQKKASGEGEDLAVRLGNMAKDFSYSVKGAYRRLRGQVSRGELAKLQVYLRAEQLPSRDSRIDLDTDKDVFGLPRLRVDWRLSDFERRSIRLSLQILAEEFGRLHLGHLQLADWIVDEHGDWPQPLWGGCHHMGTTRMSNDASTGVVDKNCRLHTVDNLYIGSSSVFPTVGYATPTLTIVALALRLAAHLKQRLAQL